MPIFGVEQKFQDVDCFFLRVSSIFLQSISLKYAIYEVHIKKLPFCNEFFAIYFSLLTWITVWSILSKKKQFLDTGKTNVVL